MTGADPAGIPFGGSLASPTGLEEHDLRALTSQDVSGAEADDAAADHRNADACSRTRLAIHPH